MPASAAPTSAVPTNTVPTNTVPTDIDSAKTDAPTISQPTAARPARSPKARQQQRGQGQRALNHFEPLNAAERFKKDDAGLNVRNRIISQYAASVEFESIDLGSRSARPVPLRGACTPSSTRHSGRQDGRARRRRDRRQLLHDAGAHPRRPAQHRAAARDRQRISRASTAATCSRHHRPAGTSSSTLDQDRRRSDDLGTPGRGRPVLDPGLQRTVRATSSWPARCWPGSTPRRSSTRPPCSAPPRP